MKENAGLEENVIEKAKDDLSLLTAKEVAELLRVSPKTVYRLRSDGRLHGVKITNGRNSPLCFRRSEVERFIQERERESRVDAIEHESESAPWKQRQ